MDISQALLCLITFNNPAPSTVDSAIEQPRSACVEHAEQPKNPKFDLKYHQQRVGDRDQPMVTGATEPLFLE
jgi:hypothetical protein